MTPTPAQRRRPGFTLIELLVVIIIIGILIALILPAIASAVRTARGAAVQAEINQIAQALASFKSEKGDYPPSRFMVNENGLYDVTNSTMVASGATADLTYGTIAQRSVTAMRKFYPQAVISTSTGSPVFSGTSPTLFYDFNGDGVAQFDPNGTGVGYVLDGSQCLVFFLGGIAKTDGAGNMLGMIGLAKRPSNPFINNSTANLGAFGNRMPPFFEFANSRLVLNPPQTSTSSSSQSFAYMPSYLDSLGSSNTNPPQNVYAYFSTNLGEGYDPNDVNFNGTAGGGTGPIAEADAAGVALGLSFTATQPTVNSTGVSKKTTTSPTPNPYTTSAPSASAVSYINSQTFQILSAGGDGVFGLGGMYSPNATNAALPTEVSPVSTTADTSARVVENDNLTNFHPGKLQ